MKFLVKSFPKSLLLYKPTSSFLILVKMEHLVTVLLTQVIRYQKDIIEIFLSKYCRQVTYVDVSLMISFCRGSGVECCMLYIQKDTRTAFPGRFES